MSISLFELLFTPWRVRFLLLRFFRNVNDLKIFGGVGRVSIIQAENFSQLESRAC